jgi:hypothetical protein
MSTPVKPKGRKTGTKKGRVFSVRIPERLAMVIERDAAVQGHGTADQHRLILELAAHLGMLARIRDKGIQRELKASGRDPAEYEAGLLDDLRATFLKLYGRPIPRDAYDLLSEVQDG